ncbi:MAG: integrase, partial [Dehalococcoidia bacterium]|nr:integrase [Dehalococcoidia bacterium]
SLNQYHDGYLDSYINFHRTCFFPVSVIDHRGRIKKTYPYEEVMTLYKRLMNMPKAEGYLRPGVTLEKLGTIANQMSDNQFAERMVNARSKLFQQITRFAERVA